MVQLIDADIETREVLAWRGAHLLHYSMSSCSQKTRIFLKLKSIEWEPHLIDLAKHKNNEAWFLGVNPRGLVPVLVLDGAVHIESNDIISLLEARFPEPRLIPAGREGETAYLLRHEDELHLDLRTLSFRFVHGRTGSTKSAEMIAAYRDGGSGTVRGQDDRNKQHEIDFYERLANEGLNDAACRASALKFRAAFDDLEARLAEGPYLLGDALSVLDVAWFVYAYRLTLAGYPLARLHARVDEWFARLQERPEFMQEVAMPQDLQEKIAANRRRQEQDRTTLSEVAGF